MLIVLFRIPLLVFPLRFPFPQCFSVLVGISFLPPFLECVVSRDLVALAAFLRSSWFVGLVLASVAVSASILAAGVLVVSGVSPLLPVLEGR